MLYSIIISILVVGLFALAMSITLIVKGKNIDSEIGDNQNMKDLGITCARHQIEEEERRLRGEDGCNTRPCQPSGCGSCSSSHSSTVPKDA